MKTIKYKNLTDEGKFEVLSLLILLAGALGIMGALVYGVSVKHSKAEETTTVIPTVEVTNEIQDDYSVLEIIYQHRGTYDNTNDVQERINILQEIANFDVSMRGLPPIQVGATQMEDTRVAYYASTRKSIWFNIDYVADKDLCRAFKALLHEITHLEIDMALNDPKWENQEIFASDTVEKMREEWAIYKPSTVDEDFYYQSFIETVADERASSLYNEYWELYIKTYTNATIKNQKY